MWSGTDSGRCFHGYDAVAKEFVVVNHGCHGGKPLFVCCLGDRCHGEGHVTYISLATAVSHNRFNLVNFVFK